MKRSIVLALVLLLVTSIAGCALKQKQPDMNQLAEDNNYHYNNKGLGFSLVLPAEFEYYQTQMIEADNYTDLEIYIPTSDKNSQILIPGYAKTITIRVFDNNNDWQEFLKDSEEQRIFDEIIKKGKKVYAIEFWSVTPADWQDKWSQDMVEKIKANFNLIN